MAIRGNRDVTRVCGFAYVISDQLTRQDVVLCARLPTAHQFLQFAIRLGTERRAPPSPAPPPKKSPSATAASLAPIFVHSSVGGSVGGGGRAVS